VARTVPSRRASGSTPENFEDVSDDEGKEDDVVEGQRFTVFGAPVAVGRGVEVDQLFNHDADGNDDDRVVDDSILPADGPIVWSPVDIHEPIRQHGKEVRGKVAAEAEHTMIPPFRGNRERAANIPADCDSPLSLFKLMFCSTIINTFIAATNSYAQNTAKKGWKPLTANRFLKFLAMILYMGLVKMPERRRSYFSKDELYRIPFVSTLISGNQFENILSCWHWEDTSQLTQQERTVRAKKLNGFWQTDGFTNQLAQNFQTYWRLQQFIDIDEMSIYFKGRHRCRCYNPNKPEKWHFKAFCLNDGGGYLWNFYMYQGASEVRPEGWSATAYPVKKLLEPLQKVFKGSGKVVQGLGRILSLDNWYTSLEVAVYLMKEYGMYLIGTVKTNRKGLPKEHIYKKTGAKKPRGTMSSVAAVIDGVKVFFTSWMDSKPVHGLSTLHTQKERVLRKEKDAAGNFDPQEIWRPTMWKYYNIGMGGTDLHDQLGQYYCTMVRCYKWAIRIFTHFLHCAVINAHILYKAKTGSDCSLKEFTELLIKEIAALPDDDGEEEDEIVGEKRRSFGKASGFIKSPNRKKARVVHDPENFHYVTQDLTKRARCLVCSKNGVSTRCGLCDAPVCIKGYGDENCFRKFHVDVDFRKPH
jgi:hypothetical protein